jgi:hypothetical protein
MATAFVQTTLDIWDRIVARQTDLMDRYEESIAFTVDGQGVRPSDAGDVYAYQRHVQAGGTASASDLAAIEQALRDLRAHLRPATILGADWMEIHLYVDNARPAIGPWGHYSFLDDEPPGVRQALTGIAAVAEQDGTGPGHPIAPNVAKRGATVWANDPRNARALFALFGEDTIAYVPTGRTEAKMPGFTLPNATPHALADALWRELWEANDAVRKAGMIDGRVELPLVHGVPTPRASCVGTTPALRKKVGDPNTPGFTWGPHHAGLLARLEAAVGALHAACRQVAPILTALDAWVLPTAGQGAISGWHDGYQWSRNAQQFELMGSCGGAQWQGPHPVQLCNAVRFRYTLERALGVLATLTTLPTNAWTRPNGHSWGGVVPGNTLAEAGLLAAALASGNKPGFVPGAEVKPADFGRIQGPQDVWIEVERF